MQPQDIRYLRRSEIDTEKWNRRIATAINGRCYADSFYLDTMAGDWDALVSGDYEVVMPLPWRKKYGVKYLFQPAFCQQLGIFYSPGSIDHADHFLSAVPASFSYWDIQLNSHNNPSSIPTIPRKNYLLSLQHPYQTLYDNFSRSALRNIQKAKDARIHIEEKLEPAVLLSLHMERFTGKNKISQHEYRSFRRLLEKWVTEGRAMVAGAGDMNGRIIASSAYMIFNNRITFIMNGNTEESLTNGATHLLKDHVINKFADRGFILDFEGSDDPDFARFYSQYGKMDIETYPRIIHNRLGWPWKWFKR